MEDTEVYTLESAQAAKSEEVRPEQVGKEYDTTDERLVSQMELISHEFPEYKSLEDLPEAVLKRGSVNGDLEKELLRYKLDQARKIEAARRAEDKNREEALGSVFSAEAESGTDAAFISGLWRR